MLSLYRGIVRVAWTRAQKAAASPLQIHAKLSKASEAVAMRALIVEDEARVAENIAAALRESAGLAVDIAGDGNDGVELGRQPNYDLIILDLMLPGMDGLAVLRTIRAKGQTAPVLVLTAVLEKASIVKLLNAGADDYE
jgi:DNA-binding response OmpR family regulator